MLFCSLTFDLELRHLWNTQVLTVFVIKNRPRHEFTFQVQFIPLHCIYPLLFLFQRAAQWISSPHRLLLY